DAGGEVEDEVSRDVALATWERGQGKITQHPARTAGEARAEGKAWWLVECDGKGIRQEVEGASRGELVIGIEAELRVHIFIGAKLAHGGEQTAAEAFTRGGGVEPANEVGGGGGGGDDVGVEGIEQVGEGAVGGLGDTQEAGGDAVQSEGEGGEGAEKAEAANCGMEEISVLLRGAGADFAGGE